MKLTTNKLIVAVPVVLLVAGGGYVMVKGVPGIIVPVQEAAPVAAPVETQASFEKRFEDVLNAFLKSVNEKAQDYKKQRRVIMEIIKPENLTKPDDVKENYTLMQKIVPEMQQQMEDIMAVFRDTETQVRGLAEERPEDTRDAIMDKWREVRDKQANLYLAFFASEQDILQAYANLMGLYAQRIGGYSYDESTRSLLFKDSGDKQTELDLRDQIRDLERKQSEAMKSAETAHEPPAGSMGPVNDDEVPDVDPTAPVTPPAAQ